jgi:hypothetical protein
MDEDTLQRVLTCRTVATRGESFEKPLLPEEAVETRDAFAKALYSRNFSELVHMLNRTLESPRTVSEAGDGGGEGSGSFLKIGILDIYGFEIFETNSFEQVRERGDGEEKGGGGGVDSCDDGGHCINSMAHSIIHTLVTARLRFFASSIIRSCASIFATRSCSSCSSR